MALEGTLRDFSLADIFQLIGIQRKTGVLTLKCPEDVVTVSFVEGSVVSADSQKKNLEDLLGTVLVKSGDITDEQLREALKLQRRTLQRLGHILIQQNYISHSALRAALKLQVTQVVYRLFRWTDGDYSFKQQGSVEYDREHFSPLSAESILMEGIRMIDEWPIIEKKIRSLDMVFSKVRPDAPIEIKYDEDEKRDDELSSAFGEGASEEAAAAEKPQPGSLVMSDTEAKVYGDIDGKLTVQDLIDRGGLGEFETCRILYDLLIREIIREVRTEAPPRPEPVVRRRGLSSSFWSLLSAMVILVAAASAVTMGRNPLNRVPPAHMDPQLEQILIAITRSHVQRLDEAIQIYFLRQGQLPAHISELEQKQIVAGRTLKDAWGRDLGYERTAAGYRIVVYGPEGEEREDLTLERPSALSGGPSAGRAGSLGG